MNSQVKAPSHNGSLDNNKTNCRVSENSERKQGVSFILNKLQRVVQTITTKKTVRDCSKFATQKSVAIRVSKNGGGNAKAVGLNRCLNTTTCPRCSHMLGVKRAKEIDSVAVPLMEAGGDGFMLTLTIPHLRKDKFNDLRKIINKCWHSLMRQRFGKKLASYCNDNQACWVRSFDYTWTLNGHHMHFHNLLLTDQKLSDVEVIELQMMVEDCWVKLLRKFGDKIGSVDAIKLERVYDVSGVSKYNNKISSTAFEIASRGTTKHSYSNSMNVWELIAAIELARKEEDDDRYLKLLNSFKNYEDNTHKLRTITYSKGFKQRLEVPDWEEVKEKMQEESIEVCKIRTDLWKLVRNRNDDINVLELINHWSVGTSDPKSEELVKELMTICHLYNEDDGLIDDVRMEQDWIRFSFKLKRWIFKNYPPHLTHYQKDSMCV